MSKQRTEIINQSAGEMSPADIYNMTRSPKILKMSEHVGECIPVKQWLLYNAVDIDTGEIKEILSVMNDNGAVFATNSATFIDEFISITEIFELTQMPPVEIISGTSKAGRTFITCAI